MYMDPELGLEPNGKLYWLFETHGMVAIQENVTLPPRDSFIKYYHQNNKQELENNTMGKLSK